MAAAKWLSFFKEAGIPSEPASDYAVLFTDNRMRMDMLNELTKEILADLGVKVMGDVIAILRHSKKVYAQITRSKAEDFDVHKTTKSIEKTKKTSRSLYSDLIDKPVTPPVHHIDPELAKVDRSKSVAKQSDVQQPINVDKADAQGATKRSGKSLSQRFAEYNPVPAKKKKSISDDEVMTISVSNDSKRQKAQNTIKIPVQKEPSTSEKKSTSAKKTVFDRLDSEPGVEDTAKTKQRASPVQKITRTTTAKNTIVVNQETKSTGSVFDRLGGSSSSLKVTTGTAGRIAKISTGPSKQSGKTNTDTSFKITLGKSSADRLEQKESIIRPIKSVKPIPRKPLAMDIESSAKTKPLKPLKKFTPKSGAVSKSQKVQKNNSPRNSKSVFDRLGK